MNREKRLMAMVLLVAAIPPQRRNRWAQTARIPWQLVEDCRAEVALAGIDWREVARKLAEPQPVVESDRQSELGAGGAQ